MSWIAKLLFRSWPVIDFFVVRIDLEEQDCRFNMQPDHCSKHSSNEDIERKGWLILVNQHWPTNFFLLDSSWKDRCSAGSNESMELMLVWLFVFDFELCPPSQIGTSSLIFNAERCCKCQQMTLRCRSLVFVHSLFLSSLVSPHCSFYPCCSFPSLYLRLILFLLYRASSSIAGQFFFFISTLHILFPSIWRAPPFSAAHWVRAVLYVCNLPSLYRLRFF